MQNNYGLVRESAGKAVLKAIPVPDVEDDYILVRTVAVALNPTDWTTLDAPGDNGTLVGCDFAGVVEDVGGTVTVTGRFRKGDRVAGFSHGGKFICELIYLLLWPSSAVPLFLFFIYYGHSLPKYLGNDAKPHTGAFARYIVAKAALAMHIPDNVSFEAASTVCVGFCTAGYALYKVLGLPFPGVDEAGRSDARKEDKTLLIYGGSTATGTIAIQLAKL